MPYRLKAALCFTVLILLCILGIESPALAQQEEEDDLLLFLPAILSGKTSKDNDLDGFSKRQGDCNDRDATIHPKAIEICGDGIDQDCNGSDLSCRDVDNDGDGYTENQGDCNDAIASIYPGATEICDDGIDQDCNGKDRACVKYLNVPFEPNHGGTCVCSSFTMVLNYYNPNVTFAQVYDIFGLPPLSSALWKQFEIWVEDDLNMEMEYYDHGTIEDVIRCLEQGYPVVVQQFCTESDRTGHDRVVVGYEIQSRTFILNDPGLGQDYRMTFILFDDLWNFNDYGSTRNLYLIIPKGSLNPLFYKKPYKWY